MKKLSVKRDLAPGDILEKFKDLIDGKGYKTFQPQTFQTRTFQNQIFQPWTRQPQTHMGLKSLGLRGAEWKRSD